MSEAQKPNPEIQQNQSRFQKVLLKISKSMQSWSETEAQPDDVLGMSAAMIAAGLVGSEIISGGAITQTLGDTSKEVLNYSRTLIEALTSMDTSDVSNLAEFTNKAIHHVNGVMGVATMTGLFKAMEFVTQNIVSETPETPQRILDAANFAAGMAAVSVPFTLQVGQIARKEGLQKSTHVVPTIAKAIKFLASPKQNMQNSLVNSPLKA